MKKALAATAAIALLAAGAVIAAPAASATTCNDGSWSNSSGRGTCSWHGGIDRGYGYDNYSGRGYSNNYGYSGRGYSNNYDYGSRSSSIYGYDSFGW